MIPTVRLGTKYLKNIYVGHCGWWYKLQECSISISHQTWGQRSPRFELSIITRTKGCTCWTFWLWQIYLYTITAKTLWSQSRRHCKCKAKSFDLLIIYENKMKNTDNGLNILIHFTFILVPWQPQYKFTKCPVASIYYGNCVSSKLKLSTALNFKVVIYKVCCADSFFIKQFLNI